ncbi:unannotated protein [freshwater metagenome]|uniref:Unannotated protein n=1 Tax=freshwater metagenome TaxID=449393 RepID=A0A6J7EE14_9ZZZZ
MDAGQRDHTQVDVLAVDLQADAAVLGNAALGDIELRHDLHAADRAGHHATRDRRRLLEDAVDPQAHAQIASVRLEMDVRCPALDALGDDPIDQLDQRRVVGAVTQLDDLRILVLLIDQCRGLNDFVESGEPRDQGLDVVTRRYCRAHVVSREHRDLVDGEHVLRVCHHQQEGVVAAEGNRHRLVALGLRRRDEVRRRHVDAEGAEVDVIESVTLGDRARQRLLRDHAPADQRGLERRALRARLLTGTFDARWIRKLQFDDNVLEEPRAGAAARRRDPIPSLAGGLGNRDSCATTCLVRLRERIDLQVADLCGRFVAHVVAVT